MELNVQAKHLVKLKPEVQTLGARVILRDTELIVLCRVVQVYKCKKHGKQRHLHTFHICCMDVVVFKLLSCRKEAQRTPQILCFRVSMT